MNQQKYIDSFVDRYNAKTALSKRKAAKYTDVLADSRRSAGFRKNIKELLYPITANKGEDVYIHDIDGNVYSDISMGFGALLFGHMPQFLKQALLSQLESNVQLGPQSHLAGEVAQLLTELTGTERMVFCNTGTEAMMTSIRLARLKTNRQKIVIFEGSYHGYYDATLAIPSFNNTEFSSIPFTPGLPKSIFQDIYVLPYNKEQSLDFLKKSANEIAAIIVEPVRGRFPNVQSKEFLINLREIASNMDAVLIFDEVVTGFRCHTGGAQAYFGIRADLVIYGKALANGLPIGVVAGNANLLSGIDGGSWYYNDMSYPTAEVTFFAGTFNKNPLTVAAAYAVLTELKKSTNNLQVTLSAKTQLFVDDLNDFFDKEEISIHIHNFSSLFRFEVKHSADIFFYHLLFNNLYVWEGRSFYFSVAHQKSEIEKIANIIKENAYLLKEKGFFL